MLSLTHWRGIGDRKQGIKRKQKSTYTSFYNQVILNISQRKMNVIRSRMIYLIQFWVSLWNISLDCFHSSENVFQVLFQFNWKLHLSGKWRFENKLSFQQTSLLLAKLVLALYPIFIQLPILINVEIIVNIKVFRAKIYSPSFFSYLPSLISAVKKAR